MTRPPSPRTEDLPPLTPTQFRILQLLKSAEARDAQSLAEVLLVGEAAVRQHLSVLEAAGLVTVVVDRGSPSQRGRPCNCYVTKPLADRYVPDGSFVLLADFFRAAVRDNPEAVRAWVRAYLTAHFSLALEDAPEEPAEQFRHFAAAGMEWGSVIARGSVPAPRLSSRVYHCPIAAVARLVPMVCEVELDLLREMWPDFDDVRRDAWRIAGAPYCEFSGIWSGRSAPRSATAFEPPPSAR